MATRRGTLIPPEDRSQLMKLFREGFNEGASAKAIADLIGICSRRLRRGALRSRHKVTLSDKTASTARIADRVLREKWCTVSAQGISST